MPTGNTGGDPDAHSERAKHRPRGGGARFTRSPDTARRDAEACELRAKGWNYRRIAAHFNIDVHTAHDAVQNGLRDIVQEPAAEVRRLELERLDELYTRALDILDTHHVTVSNGQIVRLDGKPLPDDGPALQAIDRLLKIQERRARLLGLDAPSRVSVEAEQLGREITRLLDAALGPDDNDGNDGDDTDA